MKKVWKMVLAATFGVSLLFAAGCKNSVRYDRYENADLYELGEASFTAEQIQVIEVDWLGGSIEIEQNNGGQIQIVEDESVEKEEERMRYYRAGSVLKVQYCASGLRVQDADKNLRISLPAGVSLEIDCVSARVSAFDTLELNAFSFESTSGNLEAERIRCTGEVDLETVSGNVKINDLTATRLSAETTSGGLSVEKLSVETLEADTTSGEIFFGIRSAMTGEIESNSAGVKLKLLDGMGANVTIKTASGDLLTQRTNVKKDKTYAFAAEEGKGAATLTVETFSGDVTIE